MQVRLIANSKLPVGMNVLVNDCLICVSHVMNWQTLQGIDIKYVSPLPPTVQEFKPKHPEYEHCHLGLVM